MTSGRGRAGPADEEAHGQGRRAARAPDPLAAPPLPGVQRSTGCTEPAAVALAAALAARAAGSAPARVRVACDRGTFRNGLRAGVPGAGGEAGLALAAALGALAGDPARRLEALAGVGPDDVARARAFVAAGRVEVAQAGGGDAAGARRGVWIEVEVEGAGEPDGAAAVTATRGLARLAGEHTHVAALRRGDVDLPTPAWSAPAPRAGGEGGEGGGEGTDGNGAGPPGRPRSLADALARARALDETTLEALLAGHDVNVEAARRGGVDLVALLGRGPPGGGQAAGRAGECQAVGRGEERQAVGRGEERQVPPGAADLAEAAGRAASFARMTGEPVAVVTSGWSGNQGLVASLPLAALALATGAGRADLARALAVSHLVAAVLREAAPSPLCHAVLAASAGAAAGCVELVTSAGGGEEAGARDAAIERACQLVVAGVGLAPCDGAKPACAQRVGQGAGQALRCAARALAADGGDARAYEGGLVGRTLEETAARLARAAGRLDLGDAVG